MSIEAMKRWLDALEKCSNQLARLGYSANHADQAIPSLRQAIEQAQKHDHKAQASNGLRDAMNRSMDIARQAQKQEPVAWLDPNQTLDSYALSWYRNKAHSVPLYISQQHQEKPVAEISQVNGCPIVLWDKSLPIGTKFYTAPQCKPLDDDTRNWIVATCPTPRHIIDAVEKMHRIKG